MNVLKNATKGQRWAAVAVVVVAAVATILYLATKEETYRTIAIEEISGTTIVKSDGKNGVNAYEGMHLYSGDDVAVQKESDMTMVLDMDKYVYAEPETHFWLECAGSADNSQTIICMDAGSILNRIKDNLNEGEVYQVDTPNSTMAVRGTVFRVTVYRGEDGLVYTLVEVFEGKVQIDLKTEDGEYNGVSETFGPGEAALIRGNSEFSEFVVGEEDEKSIKQKIAYKQLPQRTAKVLVKYIDDGEELCIGKELLMDYTQLAEHKMERREGQVATCATDGYEEVWCSVCNEVTETVVLPALGHTPGEWVVALEPTCTEVGKQQKVCSVCGEVCDEAELEMVDHVLGEYQVVSVADCIHAGEQVAYCTTCNALVSTIRTDALGHTPGAAKVITTASCTQDGLSQVTCSVCGEMLEEITTNATGHSMGDWSTVRSSTCTTSGERVRGCSQCGYTESESLPTGGHSMVVLEDESVAATCVDTGLQTSQCSVCGERTVTTIAATGVHMCAVETENMSVHSYSVDTDKYTSTCRWCNQPFEINVNVLESSEERTIAECTGCNAVFEVYFAN